MEYEKERVYYCAKDGESTVRYIVHNFYLLQEEDKDNKYLVKLINSPEDDILSLS